LYSSHLSAWRAARRRGALGALKKPRGPKGKRRDPVAKENEELRRANARLRRELAQALTILEIQKKASEILGIPLKPHRFDEDA
jgi:transposase-like protein